ncbi:hypothetical protein V5799_027304, partial [Amblyomma americanum]
MQEDKEVGYWPAFCQSCPLRRTITARAVSLSAHTNARLDGQDIDGSIYHDSNNLASVSITRTESNIQVEGIVGPYTRIEPIPNMPRSEAGHIAHIIHKIDTGGGADNGIYDQGIDLPVAFSARSSTGKVPKRVDVEIFVISDTFHSKYFKTEKKLMTYVCVMINAVSFIRYFHTTNCKMPLYFCEYF